MSQVARIRFHASVVHRTKHDAMLFLRFLKSPGRRSTFSTQRMERQIEIGQWIERAVSATDDLIGKCHWMQANPGDCYDRRILSSSAEPFNSISGRRLDPLRIFI